MPFASGSGVRLAYVPETAFGVTPATPAFKAMRVTSGGLRTNKSTGTSNERQPDRNIRDVFELGQDVTGNPAFELTYGSFDDLIAGALFNTWATNVLKNGVTPASFTFEEMIALGGVENYSRFTGVMVNTLSLNIAAREPVTGSLALMAQKETLDTAPISSATYAAASTTPVATASANVAAFTVTGMTGNPTVRSLSLEISNNLRTRPAVGTKYSAEFGAGSLNVTGNMSVYFESNEIYQKVLDHASGSLSFVIGNAANQKYRFTLPKIRFGDGERAVGGKDDDVMINLPFQAILDTTENCSIKIERAVA